EKIPEREFDRRVGRPIMDLRALRFSVKWGLIATLFVYLWTVGDRLSQGESMPPFWGAISRPLVLTVVAAALCAFWGFGVAGEAFPRGPSDPEDAEMQQKLDQIEPATRQAWRPQPKAEEVGSPDGASGEGSAPADGEDLQPRP